MKTVQTVLCSCLFLVATSALAADFSGTWCRPQHSGMPDDIIWVASGTELYSVRLTEGWQGKNYSQGVASEAGNKLIATLKGESSGKTIHAVMTLSGNQLSYRSYKDNQTSHYWQGNYQRCSKP
ncbi:hypothetical protein FY034_09045 [Trichlorobacter lovleyi]|uniref:hypothetical protein n=1 Tax=Trichlorobacter lovleyi TaxID=313985 RepID=UPI00223EEC1D|nr:hypothetical protein [Trichlorobacter lovleyi]QOX79067.1 hypothetical protein FY034_09045 [Trichlorobacter lovleyi]